MRILPDTLKYRRDIYDVALTRPKNPGEGVITNTGTIDLVHAVRLNFPYDEVNVESGDVFQMNIEISLLGCMRGCPHTLTPIP